MSLYQKYRPRDFDSLVGQEFVKISLKNALHQNRLVGAYLFYGSRGTGKTTTARILAKAMNCLDLKEDGNPCLSCNNCEAFEREELLDIIEIDAASNTGVDNIRELIEKAQFQPNQSKFKVYIIDEVHMLSKGAFNALLKTLEEPPQHVRFILATTEIHKIPETIISRTQRYDFKRISEKDIIDRLKFIAHSEGIVAETEALALIARLSRGGLRDAIAFFEQYSIGGTLKLDYLKDNLQLVGDEFLKDFLANLSAKSRKNVLENLDFLRTKGIDVKIFLEELTFYLHSRLIEGDGDFSREMELYELFLEIYGKLKSVPNTFLLLEFSIIRYISGYQKEIVAAVPVQKQIVEKPKEIKKEEPKAVAQAEEVFIKEEPPIAEAKETIQAEEKIVEPKPKAQNINFEIGRYIESMKTDKGKGFVMMSLKSSRLVFKENTLNVYANNEFNFQKLSSGETKGYLLEKLQSEFSPDAQLSVVLDGKRTDDILQDINDIF